MLQNLNVGNNIVEEQKTRAMMKARKKLMLEM
jgi:hypothetical protein